jgi:hypothetical protein
LGEKLSFISDIFEINHPIAHTNGIQIRAHMAFAIILFNSKKPGRYNLFIQYPPTVRINSDGTIPHVIILLAFLLIPIVLRKACIVGNVMKTNITVPRVINK